MEPSLDVSAADAAVTVSPAQGRLARFQGYQALSARHRAEAEALGRRSRLVSNLRGLAFAILVVGLLSAAFSSPGEWPLRLAVGIAAGIAFAILIAWHARIIGAEDLAWRFWRVNENAALRASDQFQSLPEDGAEFLQPEHPYSADLDLFGPRSLFQFSNVAHTSYGQSALARWLSSPGSFDEITARQTAVRELESELALRQRLEAYSLRSPNPPDERKALPSVPLDLGVLLTWAESQPGLSPRRFLVWAARCLPLLTLIGLLASEYFAQSVALWALPLAVQVILSVLAGPVAGQVFAAVSSSPGAFARLRPTFQLLESHAGKAPELQRLRAELGEGTRSASAQMARFERVLGWFELRHNGMIYPFINALLLWDIHCVVALEAWQMRSGRALRPWLEALGEWEALSSLAGIGYDNPDFSYPQIVAEPGVFEANGLGHPLIPARSRVVNDVVFAGPGSALLVTGSNMSGKSTLLRAMGLAAVLALAGARVCVKQLRISRFEVYTSMRISDSLAQGVSHFYAELQKLRATVLAVTRGEPVFFLLDEILHGTNSEERQIGARWVLAQLIEAGAIGAVSTHDLGLCELPEALMHHVRTVHLRESVSGEQMTFDYKVWPGPVRGGNALRLMRSLGLEVPLNQHGAS
ncbi:MAG TPA: DNA mismatch repair protein MutS [Polyangiaceae bacterium]|nr:DNA mismatch repair protein MutS [Polyangiaceae bacterium]